MKITLTAFASVVLPVSSAFAEPPPAAIAPAPALPTASAPAKAEVVSPVGKAPPPITVAKWVKGEPLTGFEKGTVYVVDFWATWCGPCKATIPHLSKLAQKHREPGAAKVQVIGVSISEKQTGPDDTSYIEQVQKFVDKQADRMDYRVAVDTPDKKMHTAWFKPAGTGGIPTAYIIDQKGVVAWVGIGTPAVVERIVEEVVAGTFDAAKEAARQAREDAEAAAAAKKSIDEARASGKKTDDKVPGYKEAMASGNTAAAIEALNQAFKDKPELEYGEGLYQWKINALLTRHKQDEVEAYLKDLLARTPGEGGKNPSQAQIDDMIAFYSACVVRAEDEKQVCDDKLILRAAQVGAKAAKPDSRWSCFTKWRLGWAYFHVGEKEKAIAAMQDAIDSLEKLKGKFDFGDLPDGCADAMKTFKRMK